MLAILALAAVGAVVAIGLFVVEPLNPQRLSFVAVGKAAPEFQLPPVKGRSLGLSSADLRGEVSLVNVFASWCTSCREEHPLLMQLAKKRAIPIHGLNYRDTPDDAAAWLDREGDPYTRTDVDPDGRVGNAWGVYGVPKAFIIDREGRIAYRQSGPLNERVLRDTIFPLTSVCARKSRPGPSVKKKRYARSQRARSRYAHNPLLPAHIAHACRLILSSARAEAFARRREERVSRVSGGFPSRRAASRSTDGCHRADPRGAR